MGDIFEETADVRTAARTILTKIYNVERCPIFPGPERLSKGVFTFS